MNATTNQRRGNPRPPGVDRRGVPHLLRTTALDYARNPVNLVFLVLVPTVFVLVAADTLADAAVLIGRGDQAPLQVASAGWATSFLAGLAMYFQVAANRVADRRLVLAGFPARRLTLARLTTGLGIAVTVTAVATLALAVRGDLTDPARVAAGTLLAALVYLGIGAVVAVALPDPLNGSIALLFIWILDVFFGPILGSSQAVGWRLLPTHFTSLWTVDIASGHSAGVGDLGWALVWLGASLLAGFAALNAVVPRRRRAARRPPYAVPPIDDRTAQRGRRWVAQVGAACVSGLRQLARTPVLWLLLAAVPAVFILLAEATTPHSMTAIVVTDAGRTTTAVFDLADIHGGTMAPIAVSSLAMLAGLFQSIDTRAGDRRLVLTGYSWTALAAARCGTALTTAAVAVVASLVTAAFVFGPASWPAYVAGNAMLAAVFVLLGAVAGPLVGKVAGTFIAFLVPFLDVGLGQSPMLHDAPPRWAQLLPGYGACRVLLDGALTPGFDQWTGLAVGVGWLVVLLVAAVLLSPRPRRAG